MIIFHKTDISFKKSFQGKNKRLQPLWSPPQGTKQPKLCLYNSLTRNKVTLAFLDFSLSKLLFVKVCL